MKTNSDNPNGDRLSVVSLCNTFWIALKCIVWAILVLGVCVVSLSLLAKLVDCFDVAQRALDAFAPYVPLVPWILILLFLVWFLRTPEVLAALIRLIDRVKKLPGGLELDSIPCGGARKTNRYFAEIVQAAPNGLAAVEKVLDRQEREDSLSRRILIEHRERVHGEAFLPSYREAILWNQFGDFFKLNGTIVFADVMWLGPRLFGQWSYKDAIRRFDNIRTAESFGSKRSVTLHVLICLGPKAEYPCQDRTEWLVDAGDRLDIRVFLYYLDENDNIKAMENIK